MEKNDKKQEASGRNIVYQYLRSAILKEQLKAGERIIERKVAESLNISRTPVREAIRKLEQEGLVKNIPNRGVVVASFSTIDVWEIYNIRSVLEGLAAKLAAQQIKAEELAQLEDLMVQMGKSLAEGDYDGLEKAHVAFHHTILAAARSPRLEEMAIKQADYVIMFTHLGYNAPGRRLEARDEHRKIMEALKRQDPDAAEKIARRHIERSCQAYFIQRALNDSR